VPAGVSAGVVVVAGVSAGVVVSAGVSAGEMVPAGVVVSVGVSSFGWQAASVVTKPSRTRTKIFDFTVNILTFISSFRRFSYPDRNVKFISHFLERTFWGIFYYSSYI
jgi:hypothetical protein